MTKLRNALLASMLTVPTVIASASDRIEDGPDHNCTSWMIFADLTGNNTNILHKNRDAKPHNVTALRSTPDSPRKWIGLGNDRLLFMGMNAAGLAGCMNSGEVCIEPAVDKSKKRTPMILQSILENCDTAQQAAESLQDFIRRGDYYHGKNAGSIFLFTDRKEGYICEITAKFCSVQRYDSGYAFRANNWHNPGMAQRARKTHIKYLDSCGREAVVREVFNAAIDKKQRLDLTDVLELSRRNKMPEDSPLTRATCFKHTNSTSTLVIHRDFPDVLSTAYVHIGHPRHTLYLPIPICVEKLDCRQEDPVWAKASWKRFDRLGLNAPIPAEWTAFEKESMETYAKACADALVLLRKGKKAQAIQTLNEASSGIWRKAAVIIFGTAEGQKQK